MKRSLQINIRVTPSEKAQIDQQARVAGHSGAGSYLRVLALRDIAEAIRRDIPSGSAQTGVPNNTPQTGISKRDTVLVRQANPN